MPEFIRLTGEKISGISRGWMCRLLEISDIFFISFIKFRDLYLVTTYDALSVYIFMSHGIPASGENLRLETNLPSLARVREWMEAIIQ